MGDGRDGGGWLVVKGWRDGDGRGWASEGALEQ